jgi:hypothetical protein
MGLSTALKPTTMASGRLITEVLIKTLVIHFTTTMAVGHLTSLRQVSFNLLFLSSIGQQRAFISSSIEFILTDDVEKDQAVFCSNNLAIHHIPSLLTSTITTCHIPRMPVSVPSPATSTPGNRVLHLDDSRNACGYAKHG